MRKTGIALVVLWGIALCLLVATHEAPESVENILAALHEKTGIDLSADVRLYEACSAGATIVLPLAILLLLFMSTKTVRQLREELRQCRGDVEAARSILRGMEDKSRAAVRTLVSVQLSPLLESVSTLEKNAGSLERMLEETGQSLSEREVELGARMEALQQRLERARQSATELKSKDGGFRKQLDAVDTGCSDIKEDLDSIDDGTDPADHIDELARSLNRLAGRIKALEALVPRAKAVKQEMDVLQERFKKLQASPEQSDIGSTIEDLQSAKEEFEGELDDAEGKEDPSGQVDKLEEGLDDLKERVKILEDLNPRIMTFRKELATLKERLEKADCDEKQHLSDIVEELQTQLDDFEGDLKDAETTDDRKRDLVDLVDDWDLGDLQERVKALEELGPRVKQFQTALRELAQRFEAVEDPRRMLSAIDRLKDKLTGDMDGLNVPDDDAIEALETQRDELRERLEELQRNSQRAAAVRTDMERMRGDVDAFAKPNGAT